MKKVTSVLNIDEFPFRISGDESSKKRRRLDKSFQHPITADRWLMSEDLLTASDVADLSLALKIYKNIRSRSTQIDDRFVTDPEVKEALNHSCFFNAVEAFTLLGQYEIRRKIKCDDSVTSFKKHSDEERVNLFYQWAHYLFSELSLATGVQTKDALIRLNKIRGVLSNEDQCRIQYAKGRLMFIQNLPEGLVNGFNFSPIDVLSRVFSGALTLSLRDKAQIIFNSHRLHDCFLSLDKTLVEGEVSSQFRAQHMPLVRFYLALSGVMASVMYAPHHNSPGDLLRGFSSSTHGEFDRCFEFAKLLDDNIQASIQSLLSFFELELRSPIAKSAFNLLGELYIRFGAKPYAQAIYSDALVQLLSDPMVAHVQLKHLYFLCTNDEFNLDVDRAIQYMGMIGGKNKINIIDHKILDLYACNFIEGSLFHVLKSQFESHPDQITAWLHQLPEYSNVSNVMTPIKYLENKKIALLMPLISSSSPYFDVLIRRL